MKCTYCNSEIDDNAKVCPYCGADVNVNSAELDETSTVMRCPACGELVEASSAFCPYCGEPLIKSEHNPNRSQIQPIVKDVDESVRCERCNSVFSSALKSCPYCGKPVAGGVGHTSAATTYEGPLGNPTPILVFGILGLALGFTPYISFLGIIFSAIALSKYSSFQTFTNWASSGQARTGHALAIAGLIVSIIMTVVYTILFILLIAMV